MAQAKAQAAAAEEAAGAAAAEDALASTADTESTELSGDEKCPRRVRRRVLIESDDDKATAVASTAVTTRVVDAKSSAAPPRHFDAISNDLIISFFASTSFTAHGTLRAVCRRFRAAIESRAFRAARLSTGNAEHGVLYTSARGSWMLLHGRWRRSTSPPAIFAPHACSVALDGEVWVIGATPFQANAVRAFQPRIGTWRSCAPIHQQRIGACAGVIDGALVVAGGQHNCRDLSSVEAYDPSSGAWTSRAPLPCAVRHAAACAIGGKLFVAGGADSDALQVWDGAAWALKAPLPQARHNAASVALGDGRMMLIGGIEGPQWEPTRSVLIYDPAKDRWDAAASLPFASGVVRAIERSGSIVVVGSDDRPNNHGFHQDRRSLCVRYCSGAWLPAKTSDGWADAPRDLWDTMRSGYVPCLGSLFLG